jgi:hypothetical protein
MTLGDAETLQESSKVLWGACIRRVRLNIQYGFGKFYSPEDLDELFFDFREPLPVPERIRKHRRIGSLSMGTDCGARLEQGGRILVGSSDSVAKIMDHFPKMVGIRLLTVEVRPPGGDTRFIFENDLILNCFPARSFPARSRDGSAWGVCTGEGN